MSGKIIPRWLDHITIAGPLRPIFQRPGKILGNYIEPGMTVLDIGCGNGFFSLGMARMAGADGTIVCVDTKAEVIEDLTIRAKKSGLERRINTRICDEYDLGIDDLNGQIDFALAFYVLHHAADIYGMLTQVHTALRPGGKLLVVDPAHHASPGYCASVESGAQRAGFSISEYPGIIRNWSVLFIKE